VGRHSTEPPDDPGVRPLIDQPAAPPPFADTETALLPATPGEPDEPADHGRLSPVLIGVIVLAVALFVAGAAWAVTKPSHGPGTAPEAVATDAPFGQAQQGSSAAGTLPSATGQPTSTGHSPSRSLSPSATAVAATGTASASASPPVPTPAAAGSGPTGRVSVAQWPSGAQVSAVVVAGSAGLSGWQATITCKPGIDTGSIQLWAASRVGAGSGDAGTWLTVRNLDWNGSLPAGGSTAFGFTATRTGTADLTCTIAVTAH
jgi:Cellulose binding domain